MTPDVAVLAQAAAKHGVPPAILFALGSQVSGYSDTVLDGGVQANETIGVFGLKPEQARLYGYQPADLKGNLELQADLAARLLAQDFAANGSWESALSQYVSGDPNAYQSPTSPLGGRVNAVLGIAAARSTYGLNQMGDAVDLHSFLPGATSFAQSINRMASLGGVVSQQHASSFSQRVQQLSAGQSHQAGVSTEAAMAEVLRQAQLPVTQANVALLSTMAQGEGMDPHSYNWLATTQGDGVGTVPGTPGVKVFGSYQDGIQNTAATLLNGNYTPLVNLMRSGADLHTMASSPGVQSALRTWQGGSSEDVNNLLRQPNVSGQPWAAPASGGAGGNTVTAGLQAAAKNNAQDYSAGQCTYYAARSLGFIPGRLGDAMDWAHNAAAMGMSVDHRPAVGTAVVYGPGGAYSPEFGHVAVVTKVNADGSFQVSEMNVDGQYVADTRQSSMADVIGFIHPPPGTDMATAAPGLKQTVAATATPAQPGAAPTPQRPQPRRMPQQDRGAPEPTPQQISRFAEHAQAAGLGPADVERLMPQVAPLRRMLLEQGTSLDDLAPHRGKAPEEILAAIRGTPHPLAPNVMAGDLVDRFHQATLHALPQLRRMPHVTEAASFAASGLKDSEIAAYYQRMADAHQATSAEPLAQTPHAALTETEPAQPSDHAEVIQLRQQERAR